MSAIRFEPESPPRYDRLQLVVRALFLFLLALVGAPLGWVFGVLYLALPAAAAATISTSGPGRYRTEVGPRLVRGLRWLLALHAYLALLTDRPPIRAEALGVQLEVEGGGTPTVASSLLRLVTSLPAALLLWVLGLVAAVLWVVGAVAILATERCPAIVVDFQRGLLRAFARFLVHHASLVAGPVPLRLDTGHEPALEPAPTPS